MLQVELGTVDKESTSLRAIVLNSNSPIEGSRVDACGSIQSILTLIHLRELLDYRSKLKGSGCETAGWLNSLISYGLQPQQVLVPLQTVVEKSTRKSTQN